MDTNYNNNTINDNNASNKHGKPITWAALASGVAVVVEEETVVKLPLVVEEDVVIPAVVVVASGFTGSRFASKIMAPNAQVISVVLILFWNMIGSSSAKPNPSCNRLTK